MSERSVAEIVATPPTFSDEAEMCASCGRIWDPSTTKRSPCCGDCWYPPQEWALYLPQPTVDDLLAWLRERETHVYTDDDLPLTNTPVGLAICWGFNNCQTATGPTLLAALEAAVRVVAGES